MSAAARKPRKAEPDKSETVIAYKGFDKNLQCRGYQYEVGKTYTHKGAVSLCNGGFHACEHPLSVWSFYPLTGSNRFAVVEQAGKVVRDANKQASTTITIKAEIGIPGLVKAAVEWTRKAAASPTSGYSANSATSGNFAHSATSGYSAHSATSGDSANSATSGNYAHSATSGYSANSATSGNYAHSATSGYSAHSATSGDSANSATSGNFAHSATSGYSAHSATSGDSANSATSGNYAHSATSGNYANSATSGYYAQAETKGENAVAAIAGSGIARAGKGGAVFLIERADNLAILAVFASRVGENGIRPNSWYTLKDGKPVEVTP